MHTKQRTAAVRTGEGQATVLGGLKGVGAHVAHSAAEARRLRVLQPELSHRTAKHLS